MIQMLFLISISISHQSSAIKARDISYSKMAVGTWLYTEFMEVYGNIIVATRSLLYWDNLANIESHGYKVKLAAS